MLRSRYSDCLNPQTIEALYELDPRKKVLVKADSNTFLLDLDQLKISGGYHG